MNSSIKWLCVFGMVALGGHAFARDRAAMVIGDDGDVRDEVPDYVRFQRLIYAGTGCPAGSVAQNISSDKKAFTLLFDAFVAQKAMGLPPAQARKNCQTLIELDYSPGWTFALVGLDVRGYASLDPGVNATQKSTYYYQGQRDQGSFDHSFAGPFAEDYYVSDVIPVDSAIWAPCDVRRPLNVNTQVRIEPGGNPLGSGLITVDSIDGYVFFEYRMVWRRC